MKSEKGQVYKYFPATKELMTTTKDVVAQHIGIDNGTYQKIKNLSLNELAKKFFDKAKSNVYVKSFKQDGYFLIISFVDKATIEKFCGLDAKNAPKPDLKNLLSNKNRFCIFNPMNKSMIGYPKFADEIKDINTLNQLIIGSGGFLYVVNNKYYEKECAKDEGMVHKFWWWNTYGARIDAYKFHKLLNAKLGQTDEKLYYFFYYHGDSNFAEQVEDILSHKDYDAFMKLYNEKKKSKWSWLPKTAMVENDTNDKYEDRDITKKENFMKITGWEYECG